MLINTPQCWLAHHPSNCSFAQFCDFNPILLQFCSNKGFCSKFTLIAKIGALSHALSIQKKKIYHLFQKKKIKIFKIHASICKLGALDHTSSILKKKNHLFQKKKKFKIFESHASICKQGAFGQASSIWKKKNQKIIFFLKIQGFHKSCINLQTRGIRPCLIHFKKNQLSFSKKKFFLKISKNKNKNKNHA